MIKPQEKHIYNLWALILIAWSIYRVYVHVPEWMDEFLFKPLVFLAPVVWYVRTIEKRPLSSLGLSKGNFFRDLKIGLGLGVVFGMEGIIANSIKHGTFSFAPTIPVGGVQLWLALVLACMTAFTEEILARGFIFNRLSEYLPRNLFRAVAYSAVMFFFLHVPILFTTLKLTGVTLLVFIITDFIIGFATAIVFSETKTLTVPILLHAFWNMTVALYL